MAIYHLSVKAVSRSAGRTSTAAAAYRAGCEITDTRTGEIHDYTRKQGVVSADIVLPNGAPDWAADRSALWNAAEHAERRKDACVAREYEVALPSELSSEARRQLALDFAKQMADREGCAVDVAIHEPGKEGDSRNHHAHILRTTRKVGPEGLTDKLDTEKAGRNRKADLEAVRASWADLTNERLRQYGIEETVDHRSLKEQGIDREPTRHLGPAATGYERRTREPSNKRLEFEADVAERLMRAKEAGQLERESAEVFCSIIDVTMDLNAAKSEQARQRRDENPGKYADGIWGRLETQLRPVAPAQRDSNIEDAIKSYGAWASPSSVSKPLPAAPKAAPDWSQFRAFAGTMASKPLPIQPQGEKAVDKPKEGPEYFPETKEEKTEHDPAAAQQLLREQQAARSNELWEQMEKDQQEREERDRERDSGFDFDR